MTLLDLSVRRLDGTPTSLGELTAGRAALVVNVASRCGYTDQYAALEALHERYAGQGFTVVGVPCNQFGAQEPGSAEEIAEFCSATFGVTFPMTEKVEVNGAGRHPLYDELVQVADERGRDGDIGWNFEKFLLDDGGKLVARWSTRVVPDDPRIVEAIERLL